MIGSNTTMIGSNNTLLGFNSIINGNAMNSTVIGAGADTNKSNTIVLGTTADTVEARNLFNPDELKSGLARLSAGNFIKEKNKTFSVTLKVKRFFAETTSPRRTADKELGDISQFIGAAAATDEQPQVNDLKYAGFSPEEFREAFNKYLKA